MMKKLITIILTGILAANVFAVEFKGIEGICCCDATMNVTEENDDHTRFPFWTISNFTEVSLYNEYFDITARTTNNRYLNTVDAKASVFYDFKGLVPYVTGTYHFAYAGIDKYNGKYNYADALIGTKAYVEKGWFRITGDFNVGWCFLDETNVTTYKGLFTDNRNNMTTVTLGVNIELFKFIEFYGSMQSYQYMRIPDFVPTSINNRIGMKAHYWFNDNFGLYGEISHFCKHPERPGEKSRYNTFSDNVGTTAVIGLQFRY